MPIRKATLVLLIALAACGDGAGDGEGDLPDIERPACPDQVNARFYLTTDESGVRAQGTYEDWPQGSVGVESANGCASVFYQGHDEEPTCDPPCGEGENCAWTASGPPICWRVPHRMDAGTVRLDGTDPELELFLERDLVYWSDYYPSLYQPGDEVTVSGGGGDSGVEPFAMTARGVPALTMPSTSLTATHGEDLVVSWDPADSPPGTRLHLSLHASAIWDDYYVDCWSDDSGEMTVPADDLATVLPGIGDSVEWARLSRIHVGVAETELGCGVLETRSPLDIDIRAE